MVANVVVPFLLGLVWFTATGVQTKLLVNGRSEWGVAAWSFGTSLLWGLVVRTVTLNVWAVVPYAIGTALGALLARWVCRRMDTKFHREAK
jgi:hypothetical protein